LSSDILIKKKGGSMMKISETSSLEQGVGRPRSAAARQAILDAALQITQRDGFAALTIENIARVAQVGKPTIYRWWPSKGTIVFEALQQRALELLPLPENPSLKVRLITYLQMLFTTLNGEIGEIVKSLMAEAQRDPAFATLFRTQFIAVRRQPILTLLSEGRAHGELAPDSNLEVLADLIYGAMWYRLLTQHAPLDDTFANDIVQAIL
jgi:AcrR family transcriptional regulator